MITIHLTNRERDGLKSHLLDIIGKGSICTTPSWAKRIFSKIEEAEIETLVCANCKMEAVDWFNENQLEFPQSLKYAAPEVTWYCSETCEKELQNDHKT